MWALKRRILITTLLFFVVTVPVAVLTYKGFFRAPTCADGFKNGIETGVDCGGACALMCKEDVKPVTVLWASYFKNDNGSYDIGVMLHNVNEKTAPEYVNAQMSLVSVSGSVLYQMSATTSVPVNGDMPILIQNIYVRDFPAKVTISLEEGRSFSSAKDRGSDFSVKTQFDEETGTAVRGIVRNNTETDIYRQPVILVVYGADMRPVALASSKVDKVLSGSESQMVFVLGKKLALPPFAMKAYIPMSPYDFQKR